jgi:hypothetical protein
MGSRATFATPFRPAESHTVARFSAAFRACHTGHFFTFRVCHPFDGYAPYRQAITLTFQENVDFAQLAKSYGQDDPNGARRYSPASIRSVFRNVICGAPREDQICTNHVERHNLSTRMQNRRMTRLTNAHSKKWANHEAMLALWYCWYNFGRKHQTLGTTPAVAAGIASEAWTLERMLKATATAI